MLLIVVLSIQNKEDNLDENVSVNNSKYTLFI